MTVENPPSYLEGASHSALTDRLTMAGLLGVPLSAFTNGVLATGAGGGHGVVTNNALRVHQSSPADMSVDIDAGTGFVRGSQVIHGVYGASNNGMITRSIPASDPTNPRNDLVIIRINDEFYVPASGDDWDVQVVSGIPAASPVDPVVSNNYMILARVVVPASAGTIVDADITDLRTYAAAIGGIRRCRSTARPTNPDAGQPIYELDTKLLQIFDGSVWNTPWARGVVARGQRGSDDALVAGVEEGVLRIDDVQVYAGRSYEIYGQAGYSNGSTSRVFGKFRITTDGSTPTTASPIIESNVYNAVSSGTTGGTSYIRARYAPVTDHLLSVLYTQELEATGASITAKGTGDSHMLLEIIDQGLDTGDVAVDV